MTSSSTDSGQTPPGPPADVRPPSGGRVLAGRYRVGRRIGAGGMATILRATDGQMERDVAIKVLHRHLADDPEVRKRFKAEARHAASLSHPNIVAIFDQGETDLPYIVMELVDGPSLREVLIGHGPLSPEQTLAVVQPLCAALEVAHAQGLIHRDIKPENVLVTPDGVPKLADFGIARVMAATSHTATGTLVGSVHYLAPELVGGIDATQASDQYALAVVAWELMTGRKPLPASTPMAIALRHANEDIPPASRYAPEVPASLDRVIQRATDRDPARRHPSMHDFAAAFVAAVPGDPRAVTTTADDGAVHTLILPPDAHETMALSTHAVSAREAARQALDNRRSTPPRGRPVRRDPTPPATPVAPRRRRWGLIALVVLLVLALGAGGGFLYWDQVIAPIAAVPDLVGTDRAQAEEALSERGLRLEIDEEEYRLEDPVGHIIGQRPARGVEMRAGGIVRVVVSLGPRIVEMPTLEGQVYGDLAGVFQDNHFAVAEPALEYSDTVAAGVVISQDPPAGDRVPQGADVTVVVSRGIEQVPVPQLVEAPQPDAEAAIAEAQLVLGDVTTEFSDEFPTEGTVISQSLPAGEEVDKGSAIDLQVSAGPLTVEVPGVQGQSVEDARAAIEGLGLVAVERTEPQPTLGPFILSDANVVLRQIPAGGEHIQRGGEVQIYYYTPR